MDIPWPRLANSRLIHYGIASRPRQLLSNMTNLLLLLLLIALLWFWLNSLHALELARNAGKQVCSNAGVQLLDDTVSSTSLALARNESGRLVFRRTYRFEFSETGNSRLEGQLTLLGVKVISVTMEPYQILQ